MKEHMPISQQKQYKSSLLYHVSAYFILLLAIRTVINVIDNLSVFTRIESHL